MRQTFLNEIASAIKILKDGGVGLYPTETFYAIGCRADCAEAADAIFQIKNRPLRKPLPLLAASPAQAEMAADLAFMPSLLLEEFWPGPLTVILPGRPGLPRQLYNEKGQIAIRVSSGTAACQLALGCGFPLVATSANLSCRPPAAEAENIDKSFLDACGKAGTAFFFLKQASCKPLTPLPSTVVEVINPHKKQLRILREGIIQKKELQKHNFIVVEQEYPG